MNLQITEKKKDQNYPTFCLFILTLSCLREISVPIPGWPLIISIFNYCIDDETCMDFETFSIIVFA